MSSKYGETPDQESMSSTFTDGFSIDKGKFIPELPKDKCVLDFNKSEHEILTEITRIIENETGELEEEIQVQQDLIMNRGKPKTKPEPEAIEEPSSKELFEFKSRLEVSSKYHKPIEIIFKSR
jgi:hypothetical protein